MVTATSSVSTIGPLAIVASLFARQMPMVGSFYAYGSLPRLLYVSGFELLQTLHPPTHWSLKVPPEASLARSTIMLPTGPGTGTSVIANATEILSIDSSKIGQFVFQSPEQSFLGDWELKLAPDSVDAANLVRAARQLRSSDIPVAFPTETVYGLGADATRSAAVRGIFKAKQRPSDNPLIVHVSSLKQLRDLLNPSKTFQDPIPSIYFPLIQKFWPGPLTILMPLPTPSPVAAEVTSTLTTVGVRMPSSLLALALIHIADRPLAAPSANASSKPSPTTATHVLHDLSGRIDMILDGGPCSVGVESTVVDGLSSPPLILRPGALSLEMLRDCEGWKDVRLGYADGAETSTPRAPGMKYKHYSPKARVILIRGQLNVATVLLFVSNGQSLGILRTKEWADTSILFKDRHIETPGHSNRVTEDTVRTDGTLSTSPVSILEAQASRLALDPSHPHDTARVWTMALGNDTTTIARLLFSALRQLDHKGVGVIFVEAIDDRDGDSAAAVMNRLRKAAEREIEITT